MVKKCLKVTQLLSGKAGICTVHFGSKDQAFTYYTINKYMIYVYIPKNVSKGILIQVLFKNNFSFHSKI